MNSSNKTIWLLVLVAFLAALVSFGGLLRPAAVQSGAPEEDVQSLYRQYRKSPPPKPGSSLSYSPRAAKYLMEMSKLGPQAAPFLMQKLQETEDINLLWPLSLVTMKRFTKSEWPKAEKKGPRTEMKLYIDWWNAGQEGTDELFEARYAAGDADGLVALGFAALPRLAGKLRAGDQSMLPVVRKIMRFSEETPESATRGVQGCLQWWEANKEKWLIPFPDRRGSAEGD